jgi:hypothetical protein
MSIGTVAESNGATSRRTAIVVPSEGVQSDSFGNRPSH